MAGVALESLIRRRQRGYSLYYRAAASLQRDGAAEGRGEGSLEDGGPCLSLEQLRDVRF